MTLVEVGIPEKPQKVIRNLAVIQRILLRHRDRLLSVPQRARPAPAFRVEVRQLKPRIGVLGILELRPLGPDEPPLRLPEPDRLDEGP